MFESAHSAMPWSRVSPANLSAHELSRLACKRGRLYAGRVNPPAKELVALLVAISFAAGLNVYATLATLGLLAHAGLLPLPTTLHLLSNWWIIAASGMMFVIEFFVDKIPAFDLIWNGLHTFVRVPLAGLLAYASRLHLTLRPAPLQQPRQLPPGGGAHAAAPSTSR